jgi:hypothetical protein
MREWGDGAEVPGFGDPASDLGGPEWYVRQACLPRRVERGWPGAESHHPYAERECVDGTVGRKQMPEVPHLAVDA